MEQFMAYLDERAAFCRQESRRLAADDRRDEGDLAKIRANVYGICKSVFQVLDAETAENRLNGLHREWETSLAAAHANGDAKKAAIEEIKLETLREISAQLKRRDDDG